MNFEIRTTEKFEREVKRLIKKYPSLKAEIITLNNKLSNNPFLGTSLGRNFYKVRLAIRSKGRGKSGGARVITFLIYQSPSIVKRLYLSTIYDKAEKSSISNNELEGIIKSLR